MIAAITDETTGETPAFAVSEVNDTTLRLAMGDDLGTVTVTAVTKDDVLKMVRASIDNYRHLA